SRAPRSRCCASGRDGGGTFRSTSRRRSPQECVIGPRRRKLRAMAVTLLVVVIVAAFLVLASVTKFAPHERGVVYRFGRVVPHPYGPGLVMKIPGVDRMVRVPIVEQRVDVARATVMAMGGSSSPMDFTVAYKIVDPGRGLTEGADYREGE